MVTKKRMEEVILDRACELAGEYAKKVAINHMKHHMKHGLVDRYVNIANTIHKDLSEEECLEKGGFELELSYMAMVDAGINSIDLNGEVIEGFSLIKFS